MDDMDVVRQIDRLVEEEHRLEQRHVGEPLSRAEKDRIHHIEVALDQCWDLLRQRRARRAAGLDPDEAQLRAEPVVEGYSQ